MSGRWWLRRTECWFNSLTLKSVPVMSMFVSFDVLWLSVSECDCVIVWLCVCLVDTSTDATKGARGDIKNVWDIKNELKLLKWKMKNEK